MATSSTCNDGSQECFHCGEDGSYLLTARPDEDRGLCECCWTNRHDSGLEETLLDEHILTPRLVTELQADFYDRTDPRDDGALAEHLIAYLGDGTQTTTLRLGTARALALHTGVAGTGRQFYEGVKWPTLDDGTESLYAAALFLPCEPDVPLYFGVFVAGRSVEQLDDALAQMGREVHAAKDDSGGV